MDRNLLIPRVRFKPFEYSHLYQYRTAIRTSRWHAEEFDFGEDIQDFHTKLADIEQTAIKRTMLAVSQVEAENVKSYWADLKNWLQKPEIAAVGLTFAENEIVHSESYSMLLEKLGFNDEFETLLENEVIAGRVNYLTKYLKGSGENVHEFNTLKLVLFSLFVENVSLFGQFLIIKSFCKEKNLLKSIDNVVLSTQKDELCHSQFGIELIKILKEENPQWFNDEFYHKIELACKKAFKAEIGIIDWIFEEGELEFLPKYDVIEFIKRRFNDSLVQIGANPIFDEDVASKQRTKWFDEEIYAYIRNDFFNTKSSNYNKVTVTKNQIIAGVERFKNELV